MTDYVIVNENCDKMVKAFKVGGGGGLGPHASDGGYVWRWTIGSGRVGEEIRKKNKDKLG